MIESCELNYCQDGIQVYFTAETQQYHSIPYGHYELQPNAVNGRSYFKMGSYGFWWDGMSKWWIGPDSYKGQSRGNAYYEKDVYCPYKLEWDWVICDGSVWTCVYTSAGDHFGITCKCIFLKFSKYRSHDSR